MARPKEILTTGQVADICRVAPRTVTKWFDTGRLKGYKIPGSRDRRIPRSELLRFMREHRMPTDRLETGKDRALVIADDNESRVSLIARLEPYYEVHTASSGFDAGLLIQSHLPKAVFISLLSPNIDACAICSNIRGNTELSDILVIAVADSLTEPEESALLSKGFSACHSAQRDVAEVVAAGTNS